MQLEAGKKYTDRRGRVFGPMVMVGSLFGESEGDYCWHEDGRKSHARELHADLIAEYVESVQPEYRMLQDGEVVQDGDEYCGWSGIWEKSPATGGVFNSLLHHRHRRLVEPAHVESPDDWVILDPVVYADHVPRVGIDQFQGWDNQWTTQGEFNSKETIGRWHASTGGSQTRCRRKDLPPVSPKTRTVVLKEWLCWDDEYPDHVCVGWCGEAPSTDRHQFEAFDHAHETGNTRTVEIPVT